MAEGTRLLSGRRSKAYRGFESLPLRRPRPAKGGAKCFCSSARGAYIARFATDNGELPFHDMLEPNRIRPRPVLGHARSVQAALAGCASIAIGCGPPSIQLNDVNRIRVCKT